MRVRTYEEFLGVLNGLGFLLFGGGSTGMLKLSDITDPGAWFQGGADDPWDWRNRLCENRDGVYARALGGQPFLISWEWYPKFLAAYRQCEDLEDRYEAGEVSGAVWRMYQLFEEEHALARHELTKHFSKAEVAKGLNLLQREMYITISGEVQKLSADFRPVGWPSMEYTRVEDWAADALAEAEELDGREMRREIRRRAGEISPGADREALNRLFEEWSV